ncbi:MAG TPA: carboxypeptidase-like regulatory domain-containing protein [Pyrinomonadaceae bacterium]|nr:carboxypeptidase-like regulatory domain-containing protein [Pyrinomonadaceae bacterium]
MPSRKLSPLPVLLTTAICVLLQTTLRAQSTDSKTKPSGSISGKVTINDKAAPDVSVTVQSADRPSLQQPPIRARTDAGGRYRLTGLSAGQYRVIALAPAMASAESSTLSPFGPGEVVVLTAGEDVDDIDIKLVHGGVVTGRVTDADDKPVIEQQVGLEPVDASGNTMRQVNSMLSYQMSTTDDRGIYRIYGLSAGRYRVSVGTNEGTVGPGNRMVYPLTYYGGTNDRAKASIVELQEGGEATNIDIRVGRAGNTFVATGRLIDADNGQPIPGVRIIYGPARQNEQFYGGFLGSTAGSRGEFRIDGLAPGRYGVSLAPGFEIPFYSDPMFFEITDSDVTNLEIKASRGLTLSGVMIFDGLHAPELQRKISAVRLNANVISTTAGGRSTNSSSSSISPDGNFQIVGVRPGHVNLFIGVFTDSGLRNITILRIERGGADVTSGFDIQPGESISDLRVVAAIGNGTIRGTVRVIGGELPPTARLAVNARRESGRPPFSGGVVDARGRFAMTNLIAGTYEVMLAVSLPQGGHQPMPPQKQTVTVSDDGEVQVDFIIDLSAKAGGP